MKVLIIEIIIGMTSLCSSYGKIKAPIFIRFTLSTVSFLQNVSQKPGKNMQFGGSVYDAPKTAEGYYSCIIAFY